MPQSGVARRALLVALVYGGASVALRMRAFAQTAAGDARLVEVWKSPYCGCCGGWVDYMRAKGYRVNVTEVEDVDAIKARFGIPPALHSCHTAKIGGYFVEGHVPEPAIAKLLTERPDVKGVALPGMPEGSPGMNGRPGVYEVVSFDAAGRARPFLTTAP